MNWYVTAGGEPMGPLAEQQVITMLRAGMRFEAVARNVDQDWWDPMQYPPFAEALATADLRAPEIEIGVPERRWFGKTMAALGGVAAILGALAWWGESPRGYVPAIGAEPEPADIHEVAEPVGAAGARANDCDVEKIWFRGESLTPAERRANVILAVENWSTDCRWRAMDAVCQNGCDGLLSDALFNASPKAERPALARLRADRNRDVASRSRGIYDDVLQLGRETLGASFVPSATGSAASAALAACEESGGAASSRIVALRQKLDGPPAVAVGGFWMKETLRAMESCVECAGDRAQCSDVGRLLKSADEDIKGYEKRGDGRKPIALARGR